VVVGHVVVVVGMDDGLVGMLVLRVIDHALPDWGLLHGGPPCADRHPTKRSGTLT
jgi:hypothetical protein